MIYTSTSFFYSDMEGIVNFRLEKMEVELHPSHEHEKINVYTYKTEVWNIIIISSGLCRQIASQKRYKLISYRHGCSCEKMSYHSVVTKASHFMYAHYCIQETAFELFDIQI
jgi:hypothetical protein